MRLVPSLALLSIAVPGLVALPVLSPAAASPKPVPPSVQSVDIDGVDSVAAARVGAESREASVEARADLAPQDRGVAPSSRPEVLTRELSTKEFHSVGVTWQAGSGSDLTVLVRTGAEDGWSDWAPLEQVETGDPAAAAAPREGTHPYYVGESSGVQVRVDVRSGGAPEDLQIELINPGESRADGSVGDVPGAAAVAAASQPRIYTRKEWGADESLRRGSTPGYQPTIKAAVIHHTAGVNGYSRERVPSIIRGDYAYHTKSLGWSDIGYNFLVDRYGRLWEGRAGGMDRPVSGAHAGGFNVNTLGISALGNYETASAPVAMQDAIARLLAWKLSLHHANPLGTTVLTSTGGGTAKYRKGTSVTLPVIMGHRDTGYTACPGKNLYPTIASIRSKTLAYMQAGLAVPSVVTDAATYVDVKAGAIRSGQRWKVRLSDTTTGESIRTISGRTTSINSRLPLTSAAGLPLPTGDYTVRIDAWYGAYPARSFERTMWVRGSASSDGARLPDGRIAVASTTTNRTVAVQTVAGSTVSAPVYLGGSFAQAPSVTVTGAGLLVVAYRGAGDKLYVKRQLANGSWPARWETVGGPVGGRPSVTSTASGLDVLARGVDGRLWWWRSSVPGTWTSSVVPTGAVQTGTAVGATWTTDGRLHAAVHGTDHGGWYITWANGRWDRTWTKLGGFLIGDVDAASPDGSSVVVSGWGGDHRPFTMTLVNRRAGRWKRMGSEASSVPPRLIDRGVGSSGLLWRDTAKSLVVRELAVGRWSAARRTTGIRP